MIFTNITWNVAQDECFIFFSGTNSCSIALSQPDIFCGQKRGWRGWDCLDWYWVGPGIEFPWGCTCRRHKTHVMNEATVVGWLLVAARGSLLELVPITPVPRGCWIPSHLIWWTPPCIRRRGICGRTDGKTDGARSAGAKITIGALVCNNRTVGACCTRDGLNRCIIFSGMRQREHSKTAWESSLYQ